MVSAPETVARSRASSSSVSGCAEIVTRPALVVEFAAKVSVVPDCVQSPVPAGSGDPGATETVIVAPAVDVRRSVAVTVDTPPVSEIDADDSASTADNRPSSSSIVSVAFAGFAAPWPPAAVPETVTSLSGASTALSTAATVTTPALAVAPAAMVSVFAALSAKSPATAGGAAAAATVTVTAALDLADSRAVTVAVPPFSETDAGDSAKVTVGGVSSSVKVSAAPVTAPAPTAFSTVAVTVTDRPALP